MIPPGIIEVYDSSPGTWQISHIVSTPEIDSQIECRISENGVGIELVDFIDRRCLNYAMPCEGTHTDISLFRFSFSIFPASNTNLNPLRFSYRVLSGSVVLLPLFFMCIDLK